MWPETARAGLSEATGRVAGGAGRTSVSQLLEGLNPVQREAVAHTEGPLLVVAGAGSGKTRVLTHRIAHLIETEGISPFEILAITFTNKAADEMKHRVGALVGPVAEKMWVSTFHSACVRILRRDGDRLGYPSSFTIYDQADAERLTGYVIRDLEPRPEAVPAPVGARRDLGGQERRRRPPTRTPSGPRSIFERKIADVYREYQARLRRPAPWTSTTCSQVTVELLPHRARGARALPAPLPHVLVDEYQDTNTVQNELVLAARPSSTATSASWATATSRSTGSAAPTSATSSSSRRRSPTPR